MTLVNALALARDEVIWHFAHRKHRSLLTKKSSKALVALSSKGKAEVTSGLLDMDPHVSMLIFLIERVTAQMRKYRVLISRYYHEYLKGADCRSREWVAESDERAGVYRWLVTRDARGTKANRNVFVFTTRARCPDA